jgi:hypothetical protein
MKTESNTSKIFMTLMETINFFVKLKEFLHKFLSTTTHTHTQECKTRHASSRFLYVFIFTWPVLLSSDET